MNKLWLIFYFLISLLGCSTKTSSVLLENEPESVLISNNPIAASGKTKIKILVDPVTVLRKENLTLSVKKSSIQAQLIYYDPYGEGQLAADMVHAQLLSALSQVKDFTILFERPYPTPPQKYCVAGYKIYRVKAQLTDVEAQAETSSSGFDAHSAIFAGITTAVSMIPGAAVFASAPAIFQNSGIPVGYNITKATGAATLDIQVSDSCSGEVVLSTPVQGTFMTDQRTIGGLFSVKFSTQAKSSAEQATRVALNNAVHKIYQEIR